ncbi:uncharacterized protein LY79DRAFT_46954 [Colletotrichum navitas]|uniref:Uncharacterized protein n=1 Tax=Colletotrichum navitas TaxID=681940 RepID=A0AAD8UX92_9PEZI|nr:uncharacterized protein LY79DRAFT_46954 [Colletotrichum navitas]KAK1570195.1 hypothetical protein LY79DRAFT_46954 [Colletotrichum navitas]
MRSQLMHPTHKDEIHWLLSLQEPKLAVDKRTLLQRHFVHNSLNLTAIMPTHVLLIQRHDSTNVVGAPLRPHLGFKPQYASSGLEAHFNQASLKTEGMPCSRPALARSITMRVQVGKKPPSPHPAMLHVFQRPSSVAVSVAGLSSSDGVPETTIDATLSR